MVKLCVSMLIFLINIPWNDETEDYITTSKCSNYFTEKRKLFCMLLKDVFAFGKCSFAFGNNAAHLSTSTGIKPFLTMINFYSWVPESLCQRVAIDFKSVSKTIYDSVSVTIKNISLLKSITC